jgi:hypothetical protein
MIDDVAAGHQVFYDFYTEGQKQDAPACNNTGLFFYRGKPGAPFAILAPGGGFSYVGSVHEGFPYADVLSSLGYNAFVLKYRVGQGGGVATEDLAFALSYIFRTRRRYRCRRKATPYGAVPPARAWRLPSARTGRRGSAGTTYRSRRWS